MHPAPIIAQTAPGRGLGARYQFPGALRRAYTLARAGPPAVSMADRQPN